MQRLQLSITMTNELFLAQFQQWIPEMRRIASERPGTGACTLASAMQLWLWTLHHARPPGTPMARSSITSRAKA